jgi:hypothetical protein
LAVSPYPLLTVFTGDKMGFTLKVSVAYYGTVSSKFSKKEDLRRSDKRRANCPAQ